MFSVLPVGYDSRVLPLRTWIPWPDPQPSANRLGVHGIRSARRGPYRVLYRLFDDQLLRLLDREIRSDAAATIAAVPAPRMDPMATSPG